MAKLTKYTQCERFEERRNALTAARDKALEDFPKNVHADFTKGLNEAILKLDADAAEMAIKNGFLSVEELAEAKPEGELAELVKRLAAPASPPPAAEASDQSGARAKAR